MQDETPEARAQRVYLPQCRPPVSAHYITGILGTTEEQAAAIVDAIAAGDVPGIGINVY